MHPQIQKVTDRKRRAGSRLASRSSTHRR
jgi:hypothetical protein